MARSTEATSSHQEFHEKPVTWLSLPRRGQLAILFLCRLFDFFQVASLQAYVFYQVKSFNNSLSNVAISSQAGILQGCFTGAQVATAMLWGKAADSSSGGRKTVLLIGLIGTAISCLGYGFSTTFLQAACWRVFGGGINGTVGIIRTMIAEIIIEKKYQSRAFLILPLSFNVAGILGPVIGGYLADPAMTLPGLFGSDAAFGMQWMQKYPWALPNILCSLFLTIAASCVFFGLEETLKSRKGKFDPGLRLAEKLSKRFLSSSNSTANPALDNTELIDMPINDISKADLQANLLPNSQKLPFCHIFTKNVIFTLLTTAFFDFHLGAFTNLWSLFLSTPRSPVTAPTQRIRSLPFSFTGGLGMPASTVGIATSVLGLLGMVLQICLYPSIHARLGTLFSFRYFLLLFPFAYSLVPYLAVLPSSRKAPDPVSGVYVWVGIVIVLFLQVTARTFTLPATIILLNNCSPHPSVLGTVHGIGQSVSAAFRTIGPVVAGIWYGAGLEKGVVGAAWWGTAGVAVGGVVMGMWVYEGSGHEVLLEGEMKAEDIDKDSIEMEGLLRRWEEEM